MYIYIYVGVCVYIYVDASKKNRSPKNSFTPQARKDLACVASLEAVKGMLLCRIIRGPRAPNQDRPCKIHLGFIGLRVYTGLGFRIVVQLLGQPRHKLKVLVDEQILRHLVVGHRIFLGGYSALPLLAPPNPRE